MPASTKELIHLRNLVLAVLAALDELLVAVQQLPGPIADRVGEVAYLHWKAIQAAGGALSVAESKEIRRHVYGDASIRGTAALFGKAGTNHILYRGVDNGTKVKDNQPVFLTEKGVQRAKKYAETHGLAA